ncbi:Bacterial membrane protein YfhO [Aquisphaera giovannonii]|uniref:Bacterial membrane protein YfhO n=1 Tax=Aquisphaera giovannonii TaxID=406548 RepID=A0A5B9VZD5_9BACT|nr:YfhO family protein [Aquisphaera giovannonii]QEH33304.1 Bacterial membrane protein YfhO [Aquisphaera giovannonii]
MRQSAWRTASWIAISFAIAFLPCIGKGLRGDRQFGFRDAAHYYYPLYERVQREWDAGRWPLWEPEENGGMPLLGNPTAAVLYPGKLIYAAMPYPWAARVYIAAHVALAFAGTLLVLRAWGVSGTGSALGALTYAFGSPILYQYCNVIYLVGAAWLPLGFLAIDRWLTAGSRPAILGLTAVLAMQTLGGDPQSAYLLGLCGGGYAAGLAWIRSRSSVAEQAEPADGAEPTTGRRGRWWAIPLAVGLVVAWFYVTLRLAEILPRLRPTGEPTPALPWMRYVPLVMLGLWSLVGLRILGGWLRGGRRGRLGGALAGMAAAAVLAAGLSAAQLLPVLEFAGQTTRAEADGPHEVYPFSVAPYRVVEAIWPGIFGAASRTNSSWMDVFKFPGARQKIWVPSNYLGLMGLLLAVSAFGLRGGAPRRVWLSAIVLLGLLGGFGEYTSPIWASRAIAEATGWDVGDIGPQDHDQVTPIRRDRYLRDGDGGIYWLMTNVFPGFKQFRYPAKLLTFTCFGLAALAGMGWDDLMRGRRKRVIPLAAGLALLSFVLLILVLVNRRELIARLSGRGIVTLFGPLDPEAAIRDVTFALSQGAAVATALAVLAILAQARRGGGVLGGLALVAVAADLALANASLVTIVPQSLFDGEPDVAKLIREAEAKDPSPGPFRIHRMPIWSPPAWFLRSSPDRESEFVSWERATLQPKYGINLGIDYTYTKGVAELYDLEWFFVGFERSVHGATAKDLGVAEGTNIVVYPRRSYDIWNSRYFVLPSQSNGWTSEERGYASFLEGTEMVHPLSEFFHGKDNEAERRDWAEKHDYQIRRNLQAFPRSWIVRDFRPLPPLEQLSRRERGGPMQEMLHAGDLTWKDPNLPVYDPRRIAWIRGDDVPGLRPYLNGQPQKATETVKVSYPRPDRVVVEANLDAPGLVVLSDVYYPGWTLTIDDKSAPIYKVNMLMRGAAVEKGTHTLVFRYEPRSFRLGGRISIASLAISAILVLALAVRGRRPPPAADA